ncbi:MAG TPA: Gfo/Idh/MocA family oxidoreductase [bacterium]|nr:Gfo/Idh/MocA family oxidoreductase [bacterium]
MRKIKAGVAGYGRSGRGHHCNSLLKLPEKYEIVALCEPNDERRNDAEKNLKCRVYKDFNKFLKDSETELVSIATPSYMHTKHTVAALKAGKNVVCEKPLSDNVADVDEMIRTAKKHRKIFAPFQNRRHDPLFLKIKEIVDSGKLGEIVEIKITWHDFGRRWDWQTLRKFKGGTLNNSCPHIIDQGMQFMPENDTYKILCQLKKTLTCGDADDHVKIVIEGKKSALLDMEVTSSAAYGQEEKYLVMGTKGGLKANLSEVWWKYCKPETLPRRTLPRIAISENRTYGDEEIKWKEEYWKVPEGLMSYSVKFYDSLYNTLAKGAPLYITPESARRVIWVIEQCHKIGKL